MTVSRRTPPSHESPTPPPSDPARDETTRRLCAAAHKHEWFADAIVRLYLVEEVGAVPPSPGLDSAAVLRDAVSAQRRRYLRDLLVVALLAALVVLAPVAVLIWVVLVALVRWRAASVAARARILSVLGVVLLVAAVAVIQALPVARLHLPDRVPWWSAPVVVLLLAVVLGVERYLGESFLRSRFHPRWFTADATASPIAAERLLRTLGGRRFEGQLRRFEEADEHHPDGAGKVDVIVHRDPTPFVGGGFALPAQPIVVSARAGRRGPPLDVERFHRHLADVLAPGDRTAGATAVRDRLLHRLQVVVPAEHLVALVRGGRTPFAERVFGDLARPPVRRLDLRDVQDVVHQRVDGVRFYSCYRSESFSRNVVVSCYLYVTSRWETVQLELTPCILPPVHPLLDEVDEQIRRGRGWPAGAAADLLRLPLTIHRRVDAILRPPAPRRPRGRGIQPWRYGAGRSLREGVSRGLEREHWYQASDAVNTVALLSRRIFEELIVYLKEDGYDVAQFRREVTNVINNNSIKITGGHFVDTTIANGAVLQGGGEPGSGT